MKREPKKAVTVRLTLEQYAALSQLAEQSSRTLPSCIGQIIRRYFLCMETNPREKEWWNIL